MNRFVLFTVVLSIAFIGTVAQSKENVDTDFDTDFDSDMMSDVQGSAEGMMAGAQGSAEGMMNSAATGGSNMMADIQGGAEGMMAGAEGMMDSAASTGSNMIGGVQDGANGIMSGAQGSAEGMMNSAAAGGSNMMAGVQGNAQGMMDSAVGTGQDLYAAGGQMTAEQQAALSEAMNEMTKYFDKSMADMSNIMENTRNVIEGNSETVNTDLVENLINYVQDTEMMRDQMGQVMGMRAQFQDSVLKQLSSMPISAEDAEKLETTLRQRIQDQSGRMSSSMSGMQNLMSPPAIPQVPQFRPKMGSDQTKCRH